MHIPQEHIEPFAARHTRHRTGRSQSTRPGANGHAGSFEPEEFGWDNETNPIGKVKEYPSGREIERRKRLLAGSARILTDMELLGLAFPRAMLTPKEVEGANFKYQKVFGEDQFIAGGVVYIPVGSDKPGKFSKDNAYVSEVLTLKFAY